MTNSLALNRHSPLARKPPIIAEQAIPGKREPLIVRIRFGWAGHVAIDSDQVQDSPEQIAGHGDLSHLDPLLSPVTREEDHLGRAGSQHPAL
jgi:hypothetical protein